MSELLNIRELKLFEQKGLMKQIYMFESVAENTFQVKLYVRIRKHWPSLKVRGIIRRNFILVDMYALIWI